MWLVEIKHYSVAYFNYIITFDALWLEHLYMKHFYASCMSPTLSGSSLLQHLEHGNAIKIPVCNRKTFDFYPRLPHVEKNSTKGKKLSQLVLINAPTLRTLEHVN